MISQKGKNSLQRLKRHLKCLHSPRKRPRPSIYKLPIELIESIIAFLEFTELCALRSTCKQIYAATTLYFGRKYLNIIRIDFSLSAMKRMSHIAGNPHLNHHVQTVIVEEPWFNLFGRGMCWERNASGHVIVQQTAVQQWQDVLSRLVNCKDFQVNREHSLEHADASELRSSDAIAVILNIITGACIPVETFAIDFNHKNGIGGMNLEMKCLSLLHVQSSSFAAVWSHIQNLSLRWTMDAGCTLKNDEFIREATQTAELTVCLVRYTRTLKYLDLDFDGGGQGENIVQRLSHLDLCQLRSLTLGHLHVSSEALLNFLHSVRNTLRALSLSFVSLLEGGWVSIFEGLANEFPLLQSIQLENLGHSRRPRRVHFPGLSESLVVDEHSEFISIPLKRGPKSLGPKGVFHTTLGYSGRNMGLAMRILVDCIAFL